MVDIETMGGPPDGAILSIGAVLFSIHPERVEVQPSSGWFHERATLPSNVELGRAVWPETVEWWIAQSKEAQEALLREPRHKLPVLLEAFRRWLVHSRVEFIWAKPPEFDITILTHAFQQCEVPWPLHFSATRDVRTILETAKWMNWMDVVRMERLGEAHNAADDAAHQAQQVCLFHQKMFNGNTHQTDL